MAARSGFGNSLKRTGAAPPVNRGHFDNEFISAAVIRIIKMGHGRASRLSRDKMTQSGQMRAAVPPINRSRNHFDSESIAATVIRISTITNAT